MRLNQLDIRIFDGAALVHALDPQKSNCQVKTFDDYATVVFIPHLLRHLASVKPIDVVWDKYFTDSLKSDLR